ncbi:hypothetical protein JCM3775_000901 [Rhodotorula graminis]
MAAAADTRPSGSPPSALKSRTRELQQEDSLLSSSLPPSLSSAPPPLPPPQVHLHSSPESSLLLPTVQEHGPSHPVAATPSQFALSGRPRAGTLPSTFLTSSSSLRSRLGAADSLLLPTTAHGGAASLPGSGPTTPLDQPFPSALIPPAPASTSSASHSRLRSGSLTLPSSSLSSVFGSGVFSSGDWSPNTLGNGAPGGSSPAAPGPPRRLGGVGDVRSPDESAYGEDSHLRTLDYLGLADESSGPSNAASESLLPSSTSAFAPAYSAAPMQRLGSAGSVQPSSSGLNGFGAATHSRLRSHTLAAFPRSSSPAEALLHRSYPPPSSLPPPSSYLSSSLVSSPAPLVGAASPDDPYSHSHSSPSSSATPRHRSTSSTDSSRLLYATAVNLTEPSPHSGPEPPRPSPLVSLLPPSSSSSDAVASTTSSSGHSSAGGFGNHDLPARGRAATIGILDDSKSEMYSRRRAGTTAGIPPRHLGIGADVAAGGGAGGDGGAGGAGVGPVQAMASRMGRLGISEDPANPAAGWASLGRPPTPEGAISLTPPVQQPTRSLWVGNLAPKTSPADLQEVFAPYGAIESLRLIPDKECGFVNFVSVSDAMRAKEDVLNRLGGQLTKTSGLVRIGYGKAESTPAPTAPGLIHPRSTAAPVQLPGDLNLQTQPTRALWVGSIPPTTTPNHLLAVFSAFGAIESARVLTHKSCGFVNFERLDDAVAARKALSGREILGVEVGPVRIGFAKVPSKVSQAPFAHHVNGDGTPASSSSASNGINGGGVGSYPHVFGAVSQLSGASGIPVERQLADSHVHDYRSNLVMGLVSNGHYASAHAFQQPGGPSSASAAFGGQQQQQQEVNGNGKVVETSRATVNEMQMLMRELSQGDDELEEHVAAVAEVRPPQTYYTSIPLAVLSDPRFARRYAQHEAPRLREIRKRLDAEPSTDEVDAIAADLMDEVVPLASDYIGNTLVQKLFEQTSKPVRKLMLERISPHLAPIGTHKNGTWAVQKIIQCAEDDDEFAIIEQSLAPYTPPLLLNDFGNYVVQGALRFGSPWSDFVFDAMVDRIWEIGSGRFGARSTRQTLESPETPPLQRKRVAAAIVLNAIPLATSSNGALLLTWLLESSGLPNRYSLVAPRFVSHLSHLCTHKLASQSLMRVINQREDDEAQRIMVDALVDPAAKVLEDVLKDHMNGVACVHKVAASTYLSGERREQVFARVKEVLETLGVQGAPAFRKLIDEVGGEYLGPSPGSTPPPPQGQGHYGGGRQNPRASPQQGFGGPSGGASGLPLPPSSPHSVSPQFQRRGPLGPPPPPPHHQHLNSHHLHPQHQPFGSPAMASYPYGPPPMGYPLQYGAPNGYGGYASPYYGGDGATLPPPPSLFNPGSPYSPSFAPPGSASSGPASPARSPHMQHPGLPPFSPGFGPGGVGGAGGAVSPGYPSISSPDPFSALRVGDGGGFNPAFSPMGSPPPPPPPYFGGFGAFAAQQNGAGGPFDVGAGHPGSVGY